MIDSDDDKFGFVFVGVFGDNFGKVFWIGCYCFYGCGVVVLICVFFIQDDLFSFVCQVECGMKQVDSFVVDDDNSFFRVYFVMMVMFVKNIGERFCQGQLCSWYFCSYWDDVVVRDCLGWYI